MKPFDRPTEGAWQQKRREEGLSKHSTGSDMAWRMQGIPRGQLALVNVVNNVVHFKYEQLSLSLAVPPLSPPSSLPLRSALAVCNVVKNFAGSLTLHVLSYSPLNTPSPARTSLARSSPHACHQFYCRVARKFQVRQYMPRFYGFHVARATVNDLGIVPTPRLANHLVRGEAEGEETVPLAEQLPSPFGIDSISG